MLNADSRVAICFSEERQIDKLEKDGFLSYLSQRYPMARTIWSYLAFFKFDKLLFVECSFIKAFLDWCIEQFHAGAVIS